MKTREEEGIRGRKEKTRRAEENRKKEKGGGGRDDARGETGRETEKRKRNGMNKRTGKGKGTK